MYLLDTNVVSELRKLHSGKADQAFASWFATVSLDALYVSVMTIFEIENGLLLIARRDERQAAILKDWFEQIKLQLNGRVVSIDQDIALYCARINVPDPRSWRDGFIGATACVRGFTLITRNVRDFRGLDVAIINPWNATGA